MTPKRGPSRIASGVGDAEYGRIALAFVVALLLIPLIAVLVIYYVAEYGELPFTFQPGPLGLPPWAPLAVLALVVLVATVTPLVARAVRPAPATFWDQAAANRTNSLLLTAAIVAALALVAYIVAVVVSLRTSVALAASFGAVAAGLGSAALAYGMGDRVLLRLSSARPLAPEDSPVLRNVVVELATAANIPPPRLYVIEETAPNAFVAGRDPHHAVLVATRGLLDHLDREELQGVVAHELAHIRNYDSRYNLIVAIGVGAVVLIADGFFRVVTFPFRFGGWIFEEWSDHRGGGGSGGEWSYSLRAEGPQVNPEREEGFASSYSREDLQVDHRRRDSDGVLSDGVLSAVGGGDDGFFGRWFLVIVIFMLVLVLVAVILNAIAPLFARLTQVAVSREREYLADATAVELGRNPAALERALIKAASTDQPLAAANRATAPLYFVNPIRSFEERASRIFSTHPPTIARVNRLRQLQSLEPLEAIPAISEDLD